jgi:hydroxyacylglutathione hydrolase
MSRRMWLPLRAAGVALLLVTACTPGVEQLDDAPQGVAVTTTGAWHSMVYAARVASGVMLIDLGWLGGEDALDEALAELNATRDDVTAVFLTHSHRDHITGWRLVAGATFHVAAAELPFLVGDSLHHDVGSRAAELIDYPRPRAGQLRIVTFASDTVIALGADSIRALLVPGHTPGSTAYLFRGVLFVGDAVAHTPIFGFHPARPVYTGDRGRNRESLRSLRKRTEALPVELVCNAHGKCARPSPEFWEAVLR